MTLEDSQLSRPTFSLIVPVLNEAPFLNQLLASVHAQTVPSSDYEVILCDGGSTDGTLDIARSWELRFPHFRVQHNHRRLPSAGRNIGLSVSQGNYIAFLEGHIILPDTFLANAARVFRETGVAAIGRPIALYIPSDPPTAKAIAIARESRLGHDVNSLLYGTFDGIAPPESCATIYRREVFDSLGTFNESLYVGEDVDFNRRFSVAGYSHYFSQHLKCLYHPRRSIPQFFVQMMNYGSGRVRVGKTLQERLPVTSLLPLVLYAFFLTMIITSLLARSPWPLLIPVAYLTAISFFALMEAIRRNVPMYAPLVALALLSIHAGLAIGELRELLRLAKAQRTA